MNLFKKFEKLNLLTKLLTGFSIAIIFMLIITYMTISGMGKMIDSTQSHV